MWNHPLKVNWKTKNNNKTKYRGIFLDLFLITKIISVFLFVFPAFRYSIFAFQRKAKDPQSLQITTTFAVNILPPSPPQPTASPAPLNPPHPRPPCAPEGCCCRKGFQ